MSRAGEFQWIERYLAPLAGEGAFGLRDDAAVLDIHGDGQLVITQDAIAEDVHFISSENPSNIARKALRVNASDLIAKGATPLCYSLALGVPDKWTDSSMALFSQGLARDQQDLSVTLTGGDTYRSPERLTVSVTMIGQLQHGAYVSRLNARPNQIICVTGSIGDAALGLKIISGQIPEATEVDAQWLMDRHRIPRPPLGFQSVVSKYASAAMDISDGLLGDLAKLCTASEVSASVERSLVPLSHSVTQIMKDREASGNDNAELWQQVQAGGDDYQVLMTVEPDQWAACSQAAKDHGVRLTKIGETGEPTSQTVSLLNHGVPLSFENGSYTHF